LRRWRDLRGRKRQALKALFAVNRRLFKAYLFREQLDRLWTYTTDPDNPRSAALPLPGISALKTVKTQNNWVPVARVRAVQAPANANPG
jgi:hypothetical protein